MKRLLLITVILSLLIVFTSMPVSSAVQDLPYDTFQGFSDVGFFYDDMTGLSWLDIDNFFPSGSLSGLTYNSLNTLLSGSGYHLATMSELQQLQVSVPAIPANYFSDATIMGGNIYTYEYKSRNIIWGIYEDGNSADGVSYSWRYDTDTEWKYTSNNVLATDIFMSKSPTYNDLGAWVVSDSTLVPEPISSILFLTGGTLLAGRRYFKK